MSPRLGALIGSLALLATAGAILLVVASNHDESKAATLTLAAPIGLAFVGSGLVAWYRRPENRVGRLMVLTGFTWMITTLSEANSSVVFTLGVAFDSVAYGLFVWLLLAFPSGRLETRLDRGVVAASLTLVAVGWPVALLFASRDDLGCDDCPENAFLVTENGAAFLTLKLLLIAAAVAVGAILVVVLARRWRRAVPALRRGLTPVYVTGAAAFVLVVGSLIAGLASGTASEVLAALSLIALLAFPFSFIVGLLRSQLARAAVPRMLVEVSDEPTLAEAEAGLRRALGDPTLQLASWLPESGGYIDVEGRPFELPEEQGRATTLVQYEGRPLAALVYDSTLREEHPDLLEEVIATARLALEKDRSLRALRVSERRTRALLEGIPDNIFRVTRDGRYLDSSVKDERYLPIPVAELATANIEEVLPPDVAARMLATVREALDSGEVQTIEYRLLRPVGLRDSEARILPSGEDEVLIVVRDVTERKRQEHALERERDFTRQVVNSAPSFFCVLEPDGALVRFNDTLADVSGFPDDERVRGQPLWQVFVAPEQAEEWARAFERAARGGPELELEATLLTSDGERRLVTWHSTPVVDEHGKPMQLVTGMDVTERASQQAELEHLYRELESRAEELRRERELLQTVINTSPAILCGVDEDGGVVRFNTALARLSGVEPGDETKGRRFWELFVAPEEAGEVEQRFRESVATGGMGEHENRWRTPDGGDAVVAWSIAPYRSEEGGNRYLVTGVDITQRKRQEAELKRQHDFLSDVGDATPSLLVVLEGDEGRLGNDPLNRTASTLTGYASEEVAGLRFWEVFAPPGREQEMRAAVEEAIATGERRELETQWLTKDGRRLLVAWSCTRMPVVRGVQPYLIAGTDITDRKRHEAEVRASRTRIVEAADRERRRLERNLHDGAQQRLVSLSLALRLAQSRLPGDPTGATELLDSASEELAHALEELRELARGIHPAVLSDRGLAAALESLAGRAPLPVSIVEVPDERLPDSVEAAAFYVVSESLANVAKYSQASSAHVTVRQDDGYAVVEVADDGVGGADPRAGSGLRGLVDRVEALDGRLEITSPLGGGTRIRAEIPFARP